MRFRYIVVAFLFINTSLFSAKMKCHKDWSGDLICEEQSMSESFGDTMANAMMLQSKVAQENAKKLKSVVRVAKPPKNNNWSVKLISKEPTGE